MKEVVEINKKSKIVYSLAMSLAIVLLVSLYSSLYSSTGSPGGPKDMGSPIGYDEKYEDYRCPDCNVIILTIDTLRADHLGSYGYFRNTSPNIDRFAEDGVLFTKAYAQASATSQSVSSFMTSKSPSKFRRYNKKLGYERVTLAEILKENGYKTAGIVTNPWLKEEMGFAQGFDDYSYVPHYNYGFKSSNEVNKRALDWLKENKDEKTFLWLHYLEPHAPYRSHEEYQYDPGYQGRFKDNFTNIDANTYKNPDLKLTDEEIYHINALYDGEINYIDNSIGNLLSELKRTGLYDNTIIILTSDHGDEFREHGGTGHDHTLYNELINVPLIIKGPGVENITSDNQVRLMDVVPTILDILKVKADRSFDGVSLMPLFNRKNYNLEVYSKMENHHASIISKDEWKVILKFREMKFVPDKDVEWEKIETRKELYDLKEDPDEQNNLIDEYPEIANELEERLMELRMEVQDVEDEPEKESDDEISKRTKEELRSLGYVV